eukprot:3861750-Pyramimonas_sp.AAC.1
MGPADHVTNPSGSSNSCNRRHFWALALPERHSQADHVTNPRKSQAGAPSLWGPRIILLIRAGHQILLAVATFGLSRCQNAITMPHFECPEPTVGHFVLFVLPEHRSRATF